MNSTQSLSLSVLGPFVLRADGCEVTGLPRKAQALLAFLALQPDRKIPREIVADLLWTHSGPDQARHSLRQTLVALRKTRDSLEEDTIICRFSVEVAALASLTYRYCGL